MLFYYLFKQNFNNGNFPPPPLFFFCENFIESGHLDCRCSLKNLKQQGLSSASLAGLPINSTVHLSSIISAPHCLLGENDGDGSCEMWRLLHSKMNGNEERTFWK